MAENIIELKTIRELLNKKFFIPSYQRGYRWTEQQVVDLLNDIEEFRTKQSDNNGNTPTDDFYCLQPLVVKETVSVDKFKEQLFSKVDAHELLDNTRKAISDNTKWEVIDGQQRLTTMYILLSYLNKETNESSVLYEITYQTRDDFTEFYKSIINDTNTTQNEGEGFKDFVIRRFEEVKKQQQKYDNIDFFHIIQTWETIKKWFSEKEEMDKDNYKATILYRVKFIWYESVDEDPIRVFTRLNIGKIKLTNAELIKALFLNRSNFNAEGDKHLKLRQQEIASEWDNIEYTLQNDEFWLFIHAPGYDKPTRIDFIFDLICEQDSLKIFGKTDKEEVDKEEMNKTIGTDEYRTFRYFYEYFKRENSEKPKEKTKIEICWEEAKKYHQTFQEWFNDLELYHYVGYLIEQEEEKEKNKKNDENKVKLIKELFTHWEAGKTKDKFVTKLKDSIKTSINDCKDLNKQYEIDAPPKTQCRPLLLLHNIQTIINQSKDFTSKKEYKLPVFYKFPFHLFKKEKWNVEHIDSNTENTLEAESDKIDWLKSSWFFIDEEGIKKEILNFVNKPRSQEFSELHEKIIKLFEKSDPLNDNEKNQISNFTLLDEHTNKSYQNSIFPMKKIILLGKDQGITYTIKDKINDTDSTISGFELSQDIRQLGGDTAFVPPVTKMCFLKAYDPLSNNPYSWDKKDAEAYRQNILETLKDFGVTDSSNNQNEEKNEQQ